MNTLAINVLTQDTLTQPFVIATFLSLLDIIESIPVPAETFVARRLGGGISDTLIA